MRSPIGTRRSRNPAAAARSPAARVRETGRRSTERGPAQASAPAASEGDRFEQAATALSGASPAHVETGQTDYYRQRHADFLRRNPGRAPPRYYLDYGDKYVRRFAELDARKLSPQGLAWRDRTLTLLQEAIEARRLEDPDAFAQLERDSAAFTRFAYQSHPQAYLDGGLFDLPMQDIAAIARTPDLADILRPLGLKQTAVALKALRPPDVKHIVKETARTSVEDARELAGRVQQRAKERRGRSDSTRGA